MINPKISCLLPSYQNDFEGRNGLGLQNVCGLQARGKSTQKGKMAKVWYLNDQPKNILSAPFLPK
jgi:hypothetical protein